MKLALPRIFIWAYLHVWNIHYEADWGTQKARLGPKMNLISGPSNSVEFSDNLVAHPGRKGRVSHTNGSTNPCGFLVSVICIDSFNKQNTIKHLEKWGRESNAQRQFAFYINIQQFYIFNKLSISI